MNSHKNGNVDSVAHINDGSAKVEGRIEKRLFLIEEDKRE